MNLSEFTTALNFFWIIIQPIFNRNSHLFTILKKIVALFFRSFYPIAVVLIHFGVCLSRSRSENRPILADIFLFAQSMLLLDMCRQTLASELAESALKIIDSLDETLALPALTNMFIVRMRWFLVTSFFLYEAIVSVAVVLELRSIFSMESRCFMISFRARTRPHVVMNRWSIVDVTV